MSSDELSLDGFPSLPGTPSTPSEGGDLKSQGPSLPPLQPRTSALPAFPSLPQERRVTPPESFPAADGVPLSANSIARSISVPDIDDAVTPARSLWAEANEQVGTPAPIILSTPAAPAQDAPVLANPLAHEAPKLEQALPTVTFRNVGDSDTLPIDDLLIMMLELGGSDLHLSARNYPMMRVHGEMERAGSYPRLSGKQIDTAIRALMSTAQQKKFDDEWELDFAYSLEGRSRFRVNVMRQRGETTVVMRVIPWEIKTPEQLGIPSVIRDWAGLARGLVLITGPTGSGKSTTLASIIDHANRTRKGHIVTIEDPVEFVHDHQGCVVNQREIGADTHSFAEALKHVLRQDPDIILIGEMRDLETIQVALTAAETGHLVFGTLHTQSAAETISRIIDVFPEGAQQQVRTQLSATLQGIACQTLLKTRDGKARAAAVEVMVVNDGIRAQIREGKIEQIKSSLQTGTKLGMQTLDAALAELVKSGKVGWREAAEKSTDPTEFIMNLGGEAALIRAEVVAEAQANRTEF